MKKFLIYFCYAAILCSICSCSKDDVQSGVDIEFEPELYEGKNMSIYFRAIKIKSLLIKPELFMIMQV